MELVAPRKGARSESNVTVGTAAVLLVSYNVNRKSVMFQNNGTAVVYLGPANVTASGATAGYALAAGVTFTDNASDREWWAISGTAGQTVHVIDVE